MKLSIAVFLAAAIGAVDVVDARNFKLKMPVESDVKQAPGGKTRNVNKVKKHSWFDSPDSRSTSSMDSKAAKGGDFSAVYGMSNAENNEVLVYSRNVDDGLLTFEGAVATGGSGAHTAPNFPNLPQVDPLGAQDLLAVSGRCLFAVNAGSNEVSSFSIDTASQIHLVGTYATNGIFPASVAALDDLVYVLNAGGQGSIQGYRIKAGTCELTPIGETVELDQGEEVLPADPPGGPANPSEIGFTPNRDIVVVIKVDGGAQNSAPPQGPGSLNHYAISPDGTTSASALTKTVLPPNFPFAFDFDHMGRLVLVEIFCGFSAPGVPTSCVSFYEEQDDHTYTQVGESINYDQFCGCWIKYNFKNMCTYATNSCIGDNANSISTISSAGGEDTLVASRAAVTLRPLDIVISADGNHIYTFSTGIPFEDPDAVAAVSDPEANGIQPHIVVFDAADDCGMTQVQVISDGYDPNFEKVNGAAGLAIYPAPYPAP